MKHRIPCLLAASLLAACVQDDPSTDLELRALSLGNGFQLGNGMQLGNGFSLGNGMQLGNGVNISNGIGLGNGVSMSNGLSFSNGLNFGNGLNVGNGFNMSNGAILSTPEGRDFVKYLVKCALPAGQTLTVGQYSWQGAAGLAPEWYSGPCAQGCQEWVSACLLSLSNAYGEPVQIMLRSENPAIGMAGDPSYSKHEGAFYGNILGGAWKAYTVLGEAVDALVLNHRMCTAGACGMMNMGDAEETCDQAGAPGDYVETDCESPDAACSWQGSPPRQVCAPDYHRVITTYLH